MAEWETTAMRRQLRESTEQGAMSTMNPPIYFGARGIKVPAHLAGTGHVVSAETEFAVFDTAAWVGRIFFPLPLCTASTKRLCMLWQVQCATVLEAKLAWISKYLQYGADHFGDPKETSSQV